jgi:hypothetical protein
MKSPVFETAMEVMLPAELSNGIDADNTSAGTADCVTASSLIPAAFTVPMRLVALNGPLLTISTQPVPVWPHLKSGNKVLAPFGGDVPAKVLESTPSTLCSKGRPELSKNDN